MNNETFKINNLADTKLIAEQIALKLKYPSLLLLQGDLGAGKTTFVQYLIKFLIPSASNIQSPTFNIIHEYKSTIGKIWHCDFYRLKDKEEIFELGIEEALNENILIIEWPEIAMDILPKKNVVINISKTSDSEIRTFKILYNW